MSDTQAVLLARPPYDSATAALLERIEPLGVFRSMTVQDIPSWRVPLDEVRAGFLGRHPDIELRDAEVVRGDGTTFCVAIARRCQDSADAPPGPLLLSLHGGGLIMGCRFNGLLTIVPWLRRYGGVIVSPAYRLAPGAERRWWTERRHAAHGARPAGTGCSRRAVGLSHAG